MPQSATLLGGTLLGCVDAALPVESLQTNTGTALFTAFAGSLEKSKVNGAMVNVGVGEPLLRQISKVTHVDDLHPAHRDLGYECQWSGCEDREVTNGVIMCSP